MQVITNTIVDVKDNNLKQQLRGLIASAFGDSEVPAMETIINKESGFNHLAENRSSGAYGLCQSLPAHKMSSAGEDYLTNPITQMNWCIGYVKSRYGTPTNALNFHYTHNWF